MLTTRIRPSFALFLLLLISTWSQAQKLENSRKTSHLSYISKITPEQAEQLYRYSYRHFGDSLVGNPIDSIPTDSVDLYDFSVGHYLVTHAERTQLLTELKSFYSFEVRIWDHPTNLALIVIDNQTGEELTDVVVQVADKTLKYDADRKAFVAKNPGDYTRLKVTRGSETGFWRLQKDVSHTRFYRLTRPLVRFYPFRYPYYYGRIVYNYLRRPRGYFRGMKNLIPFRYHFIPRFEGYVAMDQPMYRHGDTLQWSAFVMKNRKRRFSKKALMVVRRSGYGGRAEIQQIVKGKKGRYSGEVVLGDSLSIDRGYEVALLRGRKRRKMVAHDFRLEDYQLDEATYSMEIEEQDFRPGVPAEIVLSGKDANDFNLLDARVEITVERRIIHYFYGDSVFVPDVLWKHSQYLDPVGDTRVIIPDSLFPDAKVSWDVKAQFNNSNNETHETEKSLTYDAYPGYLKTDFDGSDVVAEWLDSGQVAPAKGTVYGLYEADTILNERVDFPLRMPIEPMADRYLFHIDGEEAPETLETGYSKHDVDINAYRDGDTVVVRIQNPRQLEVHYTLYKGRDQEIRSGKVRELDLRVPDKSQATYYLTYHFRWGGESFGEERKIYRFNKNLTVAIDQPAGVYPGQEVEVAIQVTDHKNRPAKNVSISAGAVNGQFEDLRQPDVPYLGKGKRLRLGLRDYSTSELSFKDAFYLKPYWRNRMRLDTIPHFYMHYPKDGMAIWEEPIDGQGAQLAVFLMDNGRSLPVHRVHHNDRLVYYYETVADPYTMFVDPGPAELYVRTRDGAYRISGIELKDRTKTDLSIDVNNLPANVTFDSLGTKLSPEEIAEINRHTILFSSHYSLSPNWLWQGNQPYYFPGPNRRVVGPLRHDTVHFRSPGILDTSFVMDGHRHIIITADSVKSRKVNSWEVKEDLPNSLINQVMGRSKVTTDQVNMNPPERVKPVWWDYKQSVHDLSKDQLGSFRFAYTGDSVFSLVALLPADTAWQPWVYNGSKRNLWNLPVGAYRFVLITEGGFLGTADSVIIRPGGISFLRFNDNQFWRKDTLFGANRNAPVQKWSTNIPQTPGVISIPTKANGGEIRGKIIDSKSGEPIIFANLVLSDGHGMLGTAADFDGKFAFKGLPTGEYTLEVQFIGYTPVKIERIRVVSGRITFQDLKMKPSVVNLEEFTVVQYSVPLISKDATSSGMVRMSSMAIRGIASVAGEADIVQYLQVLPGVVFTGAPPARFADVQPDGDLESTIGDDDLNPTGVPQKALRTNFDDHAYWQADLKTDKNGEARFTAKFPDDVTSWKSYAVAMDGRKRSGMGLATTKAFKAVLAQLAVPRFLVQGDVAEVIGKSLNYTRTPSRVTASFELNGTEIASTDTLVTNAVIDRVEVTAEDTGNLELTYRFRRKDGYEDGERRNIPVIPVGTKTTDGKFWTLADEQKVTIPYDPEMGSLTLRAHASQLEFLLAEIDDLKNYPYWCMEQTASKLKGLLMEKEIREALGDRFKHERMVKKLIKKLEKGQNGDGTWGWWSQTKTDYWMTTYVAGTLDKAQKAGFKIKSLDRTIDQLKWSLDELNHHSLLDVLLILAQMEVELPYKKHLKQLTDYRELSRMETWRAVRLRQLVGLDYSLDSLLTRQQTTLFNNVYWGKKSYGWYNNHIQQTLLAYQLLQHADSAHPLLPRIRGFFMEERGNGGWRNTIETASILETILPAVIGEAGKARVVEPKLVLNNGQEVIRDFPFERTIRQPAGAISAQSGQVPLFFTAFQQRWDPKPERVDSLFDVRTRLEQEGEEVASLTAGSPVDLKVKVRVKKGSDYLMLRVPIPAGCSYGKNTRYSWGREVHREQFKHETAIFCRYLDPGDYEFTIRLEPRFSGSYTLNPAQMEQMYFPTFFGRNGVKRVEIDRANTP